MVGLVLVAHVQALVGGLRDLVAQMEPDVPVALAGGTEDGEIGTSLELINAALEDADTGDGAIILYDLGSSEMTAEAALEFLDDDRRDRFLLVDAPLVEGALAAAGAAAGGAGLEEVAAAARAAGGDGGGGGAPAAEPAAEATHRATLRIRNAQGLHARPAGQLVRALRALDATVAVERPDSGQRANGVSLLGLVGLGATAGTEIVVEASGTDAQQAIDTVATLVEEGFGEPLADEAAGQAAPEPQAQEPGAATDAGAQPIPGAPGLAMGPAAWLRQTEPQPPAEGGDPDDERAALAAARERARAALERSTGPNADIFAAQAEVLDDPEVLTAVEEAIADGRSAAAAWWSAIGRQRERVAALPGEVFAARAADVDDVGRRVLAELGVDAGSVRVEPGQIVVADDLSPTQMQAVHAGRAAGVVTRHGAPTSHMAIVARSLGVPLVLQAGAVLDDVADGDVVVVDGTAGTVEVDPPASRRDEVQQRIAEERRRAEARRAAARARVTRPDGRPIEVAANVAGVEEAEAAVASGADAVGLLRTEFLFGNRTSLPDEDEQVAALEPILGALDGRPAIIRTLDIGGDKPSPALDLDPVRNGFLGVRGLRLSLQRPELFRTQLRALLRLAADHPVRVMFPFVTTVDEVRAARRHLDDARAELQDAGRPAGDLEGVGIMVEVPVAALNPRPFLDHVDFVSVGTNDLFQYLTAAGRTIDEVSRLTDAAREVLDDVVSGLCRAADEAGRWVGVCGEIAAEPDIAARLVELGVSELSMAPAAVPAVKERLREALGG